MAAFFAMRRVRGGTIHNGLPLTVLCHVDHPGDFVQQRGHAVAGTAYIQE